MQFGRYIANKLSFNRSSSFSRTITRLAAAAVSISVIVVILAYGILLGFKQEIRNKVSGYSGHLTVSAYQMSHGNDYQLIDRNDSVLNALRAIDGVKGVYPFLNQAGIIKQDSTLEGVIFKGVGHDHDLSFYGQHLVRGKLPSYDSAQDRYDVLLSEYTSRLLGVDTGDRIALFFLDQGDVKRRRCSVTGIFNTNLQEFDKQFAIADLRMIQRVVSTDYSKVGGYEVYLDDFEQIDAVQHQIAPLLPFDLDAKTVIERYPTMFEWLEIVDVNVAIIIVLMFVVAVINMVTVLLILIIDRIPMIGLFKSMGARNTTVMSIFNWQGLYIIMTGLLIGNAIALGAGYLQHRFKLIGLPADTYYMDAVPFDLPVSYLIMINVGALLAFYLFTYIPVRFLARIEPRQSIQFK